MGVDFEVSYTNCRIIQLVHIESWLCHNEKRKAFDLNLKIPTVFNSP